MAWKGQLDDTHIYWASYDQGRWSIQQLAGEEKGTSHAPALIRYGTRMYMVWKGKHDDSRLWWSHFQVSAWTRQEKVPGVGGASSGPALSVLYAEPTEKLMLAWKGKGNDNRIFCSFYDGRRSEQRPVGGALTSHGPALVRRLVYVL